MTIPRRNQILLSQTPYYHCIARCVRRAFLCGRDRYSGQNFDHRRQWVVDRIRLQASVFAVDICAYAVMENHYHLVLHVDEKRAMLWSEGEVIERWTQLFRGPLLIQRYQNGDTLSDIESQAVSEIAAVWRRRLFDISWFMRALNEFIARRANTEDDCRGRFWEGRYKSQALLDDAALLSCMVYVDLNPVRAGLANNLVGSEYTSVQERLQVNASAEPQCDRRSRLLPLTSHSRATGSSVIIPFDFRAYIDLVEQTGRMALQNTRCSLVGKARKLLDRESLTDPQWIELSLEIQALSLRAIGDLERVRSYASESGVEWISGVGRLREIYGNT